jgi:uncharacterized protein
VAARRLRKEEARRIAVRAQRLDAGDAGAAGAGVVDLVHHLSFLQLDPTAAVAPAADLVAWSRLGDGYRPEYRRRAMEDDRRLFEHLAPPTTREPALALLRSMDDLPLHLAEMRAWPSAGSGSHAWLEANAGFRRRVLDQLRAEGPLVSRDLADTAEVPWTSTGWTNDRNVTKLLELLLRAGEVAVWGRRGPQRVWDLAERIYPPDVEAVPADEAAARLDQRRLRALGIARPAVVGEATGVEVEVEGTAGTWRLDPTATVEGFEGRTALLSPFDRLVHDRVRALELFDFEYTLEMYKPAAKRRWGYFALPVLHHDRLVGKLDAVVDRRAGVLRVHAFHPDVRLTKALQRAVDAEVDALARWLGLAVQASGGPTS